VNASKNLDLVRSIYADWERGDYSSVDWAHPEIEFVLADGPDPGMWTGVTGMTEGFRSRMSAWEDLRIEVVDHRELDGERVLVLYRRRGLAKASGLDLGQIQTKGASLFHIRNGEVTRLVLYSVRERAFADLGLAPEGGSPR
jgi:ketosteroid isomerase-like protein